MGVFADITLEWGGAKHVIPSKKVMGCIARIENVLTIKELYDALRGGEVKFTKIAAAFGEALRYAGAEVDDEEVYSGMFQGEESQATIIGAISTLLHLMIPPGAQKESAKATPGNAPKKAKAAAPSSSKRSK